MYCGKPQPEQQTAPAAQLPPAAPQPGQFPPPAAYPPPGPARKNSRRGVVIALATVLAVALAAVGVLALTGQGPFADDEPASSTSADDEPAEQPADEEEEDEAPQPFWTVDTLTPYLDAVADDEAEDWSYFAEDSVVAVPCGGEGAHGASPDLVERTAGGSGIFVSAQILTDADAAEREMDRFRELIEDCGEHDYISLNGSVGDTCAAPENVELEPYIRFEQSCDGIGGGVPFTQIMLQSGNAVIGLDVGSDRVDEVDGLLPGFLVELQGGAGPATGSVGGDEVVSDDFIDDWSGDASGELSGELAMQVGQYDPDGGPSRPLTGDISFRDLGCYGFWDEISRDDTSVTVEAVMEDSGGICEDVLTMTLELESGLLLVEGEWWTAVLDPEN